MSGPGSTSGVLGQPSDEDVVMNPPSANNPTSPGEGHSTDLGEKYKTLKRRFDEIEQEVNSEAELQIDARIREERDRIVSGMREIEQTAWGSTDAPSQSVGVDAAISSSSNGNISLLSNPSPVPHPNSARANLRSPRGQAGSSREVGSVGNNQQSAPVNLTGDLPSKHDDGTSLSSNSITPAKNVSLGHNHSVPISSSLQAQTVQDQSMEYDGQEAQHHPPTANNVDVDMLNSNNHGNSNSKHSSSINSHPHAQQPEKKSAGQTFPEAPTKRETRSTRQTRNIRNDGGNVIAAVAAATAEAEAAAAASKQDVHGSTPSKLVASPSSTLAHALGPSNEALSSKETGSDSVGPASEHLHMESILKVAEAAVAAQKAAAAAGETDKSTGLPSNEDPNLDPSLFAITNGKVGNSSQSNNATSSSVTRPSNAETETGSSSTSNAVASSSSTPTHASTSTSSATTTATTTPTPTSSLSNNPYLGLSTNLLPRANGSSTTPTAHPMLMPYPFFYPPPAAPGTPNSPPYPMHYNPYYYLASPMMPGPNGMYPPPANFPPPPAQQQRPPPEPQKPKAKRLKAHTVTTKSFSIPMVPRDKKGKPMLPLNVGIMTVISLGDVCMRDHFHTERYIFPVGYEVTRRYLSTVDPTIEVVYHCTILDGGDGPKFQIIPSDRPDKPIIAGTATGAWSNIVKQANAIRNRQHSNSVSGPDFFGLGQNTIKHLIQELPNADRLRDYVWQNFVEGGPLGGRHAAVIPALPEEYDASLPIGAYYPKRDNPINPNVPRGLAHYPQHIIAQAEAQKAQKLAAQSSQEQPIAGPSGSTSSASTQQHQPSSLVQPHPYPQPPIGLMGNVNGNLNIHEYQPPAPQSVQPLEQTASQAGDKRATRGSTAGTTPGSTSPASIRHTRSASRGDQQQQQEQLQQLHMAIPVNGGMPPMGSDGMMPTTFAGIMNAYPVPGAPPPPDSSTTSGS